MPSCTTSPSLTGHGFDSTPGGLKRKWFRNVPDELLTSLINHWLFWHQNSQCLRLTTLDLKPTGADEGALGLASGIFSRSEYLPTLMMAFSFGSVRVIAGNERDGLAARGSKCGIKRTEGRFWFGVDASFWLAVMGVFAFWREPKTGAAVSARVLAMARGAGIEEAEVVIAGAGSEEAVSVEAFCCRVETRDTPLLPATVGSQPLVVPVPGLGERSPPVWRALSSEELLGPAG
jgi:hypothetical protein